jgi:hypothetical protein
VNVERTQCRVYKDIEEVENTGVGGGNAGNDAGYEEVHAMNKHLAGQLLGYIEEPDSPWPFGIFPVTLVHLLLIYVSCRLGISARVKYQREDY